MEGADTKPRQYEALQTLDSFLAGLTFLKIVNN